ncbi:hypothetical protein ACLB2K_044782 [Fragaria x ananassa]
MNPDLGIEVDDVGNEYEELSADSNEFMQFVEDGDKPLYPGCTKATKMNGLIETFNLKARYGLSDSCYSDILTLFGTLLPDGNELPGSVKEVKKILSTLGMEYEKIDVCPNDCILYRGLHVAAQRCPTCTASRWKLAKDKSERVGVSVKTLWWLAGGPNTEVPTFRGYHVNGVDFNTRERDNVRSVQNSGVFLVADAMQVASARDKRPRTNDMEFYGRIQQIWEVDYYKFRVPIFLCDWVESSRGVKVDELGFALVKLDRIGHLNDPFVLATHVKQIFYIEDPLDAEWSVVVRCPDKDFKGGGDDDNDGDDDDDYYDEEDNTEKPKPVVTTRRQKKNQAPPASLDNEDLEHLPPNLPRQLLTLCNWANVGLRNGASILTKFPASLFGHPTKAVIFRKDVHAIAHMTEQTGSAIIFYMSAIKFFYAQKLKKTSRVSIEWIHLLGIPEQKDGHTCALWVMRYMKDIIEDKDLEFATTWATKRNQRYTPEEINEVRAEWARQVLMFKVYGT